MNIREITNAGTNSSLLSSIYAPSALLNPLSSEIKTNFCNNLSEELLPILKKRISFLVDDILNGRSKDIKKKKHTYVNDIYRKLIGLDYSETIGITNSSEAVWFVDKSREILGLLLYKNISMSRTTKSGN